MRILMLILPFRWSPRNLLSSRQFKRSLCIELAREVFTILADGHGVFLVVTISHDDLITFNNVGAFF